MHSSGKLAAAGHALLFGLLAMSRAVADAPNTTSHDPGIWQQHKYSFAFMGRQIAADNPMFDIDSTSDDEVAA